MELPHRSDSHRKDHAPEASTLQIKDTLTKRPYLPSSVRVLAGAQLEAASSCPKTSQPAIDHDLQSR